LRHTFLRSNKERIFIVARLGNLEWSRDLNRRRLSNVHAYFATNWKIDPARFTFAAGSRVAGEGRVEFYIGSTLWLVSYVKPGRDIASTVVIIQTGDTMVRANAIIVVRVVASHRRQQIVGPERGQPLSQLFGTAKVECNCRARSTLTLPRSLFENQNVGCSLVIDLVVRRRHRMRRPTGQSG